MYIITKNKWFWLSSVILILNIQVSNAQFVKGADISWQTQMHNNGHGGWLDDNGFSKPLHEILKDHSMTAIRLRVWVNPEGGWSNKSDVVKKAKWAKDAKMDVMIDFHYSDTFADPDSQDPPKIWKYYSAKEMIDAIWNHTRDVLLAVQEAGVTPKWVQIGNETQDGMLWPLGRASKEGFKNYAYFINTGNNAAKSIFPEIQTIVHLANGENLSELEWNLDGLKEQNAKFDIIGLSLYPDEDWGIKVNPYLYNIKYLHEKYEKKTMLCEVGMNATPVQTSYDALYKIINESEKLGSLGVFYWEPQGYNDFNGYSKHSWGSNKQPSFALDAFIYASPKIIKEGNEFNKISNSKKIIYDFNTDIININWNSKYKSKGSIYAIDGSQVLSFKLNTGSNQVDVSTLSRGLYIVSIDGLLKKIMKD